MLIPLSQAHKYLFGVSRSKTYADEDAGRLTATRDPSRGNKKMVDLSELERVYGKVRNPEDTQDSTETNGNDNNGHPNLLLQFYEERMQDLQAQLEKAEAREDALIEEKKELREMLKAEQARTLALTPAAQNGKANWWQRLTGM